MAKKKGLLAEVNRQIKASQRRSSQASRERERALVKAQREAEKAQREAEKAASQARASEMKARDQAYKAAEKARKDARVAEVAAMNAALADTYDEIDSLLEQTLDVDDWVDLEAMRITEVSHPDFNAGGLDREERALSELVYPEQPRYVEPPVPTGMAAKFGGLKRHEQAVATARAQYEAASAEWHREATRLHEDYIKKIAQREAREATRIAKLQELTNQYRQECEEREEEARQVNESLDGLIAGLAYDSADAIEEYIGIVLSNSVYPDVFPVNHTFTFDLSSRELTLACLIPPPSSLPSIKAYKYVASRDAVEESSLSQAQQRTRYANAVWNVGVRTLHEVFEADRLGKIRSISLTVQTEDMNPATGKVEPFVLLAVAVPREEFIDIDLRNAVPTATLDMFKAARSKNPFGLVPVKVSGGTMRDGT